MKKIIILLASSLILFASVAKAQEETIYLYKGTLDKMPITLYLIEVVDGCPTTTYNGMYQYDKVSKWLQVEISDIEGDRLVLVETGITGILSLKKGKGTLSGYWISPDGTKKLPVKLKSIPLDYKTNDKYQRIFDEVNYENHDC